MGDVTVSVVGGGVKNNKSDPRGAQDGGAGAGDVQGPGMPERRQTKPNAVPEAAAPGAAEFFAGMGLVRRALEAPGRLRWRTVFANDMSPMKRRLYAASFSGEEGVFDGRDVADVAPDDVPPADLWTASFPCTDLSVAGRGAGIHAGQSGAVWSLLRLLENTPERRRPRHVLFENVMGLLTSHAGADFRALVGAVNRLGYGVDPMCVDAARFTPQSRPRLFLLCARLDAHHAADPHGIDPSPARPARLVAAMCAADDCVWHARALPPLPARSVGLDAIVEDLPDDSARWWSAERVAYFRAQVHPSHARALERMIRAEPITFAAGFRRVRPVGEERDDGARAKRSVVELRTDGLAGCLRTPKGGSAKQILVRAGGGRLAVRHFTAVECARLQGVAELPEGFSESELLFALGDAVCVPAVRWVLDLIEPADETRSARAGAASARGPGIVVSTSLLPLRR